MASSTLRAGRASARPARGRNALLAAVVMLTTAVSAGCSGQPHRPAVAPKTADPLAKACEGTREKCSAVTVDGRIYRYTLQSGPHAPGAEPSGTPSASGHPTVGNPTAPKSTPAAATPTQAVLVDLGGPGRSLFGTNASVAFAETWPGPETLVFIEEPWVTEDVPELCTRALRTLYQDLRTDTTDPDDGLRTACDLDTPGRWGWTPARYRGVVEAILAKDHLTLVGAVGSSYGAARIRALHGRVDLEWLVVNSPAATALTGTQYLGQRADAVLSAIDTSCPTCHSSDDARRLLRDTQKTLEAHPVELETRTPLVEAADVPAAAIGMTYLSAAERNALVAGLPDLDPNEAEHIGRLSDSTLLRYGATDMSPAMLAYYDEICPAYAPWPTGPVPSVPVAGLLHRLHRPCVGATPAKEPPTPPAVATCLAYSTGDAVTPPTFARSWRPLLHQPTVLAIPGTVHADPAAITRCYQRLPRPTGASGTAVPTTSP